MDVPKQRAPALDGSDRSPHPPPDTPLWKEAPRFSGQTVHGTNPVTYDLSIPFEEAPFTVAISTGNSGNHASCGGFTKTTIVLRAGTTAGVWDTVGFFIIGCQLQWGKYTNSGNDRVITYPIAFSELYYANVISSDNCETFVYGISNININYRLCNGYNDDRWNGTQTSRLFAVGR